LTHADSASSIWCMKAMLASAAVALALTLVLWWPAGTGASTASAVAPATGSEPPKAAVAADRAAPAADGRAAPALPSAGPEAGPPRPEHAAGAHGPGRHPAWPAWRGGRAARAGAAATAEPSVPVRLAFRALWYLGTDPEAEKTWSRAINDPDMPEGVRSDLIVDMIDEGYTDNDHPTKADLPVIRARLEIIERHAPYAMDRVNARAFEEAYRTLLELYVRLGGEPRGRRGP
jgi:hypothetical protein